MTRGGFDFKKRRSFPGWGARREWPAINPVGDDPTTLANVRTTASKTVPVRAWLGQTSAQAIVTATDTVLKDNWSLFSSNYGRSADWVSTSHSLLFPISGMVTLSVYIEWPVNPTEAVLNDADLFIVDSKSTGSFHAGNYQQQTSVTFHTSWLASPTRYDVHVYHAAGANRDCTGDLKVMIFPD